jgi:cobalamin biosynthesis protein CbiD
VQKGNDIMKNINIQDKANIKGNGIHTFPNAKPVVCIETGEVFTSVLDAAASAGVADSSMVSHLKGRSKTCNGKHFCYLSRANESLDAIVTRLREASTDAEDARKWRAYQAEQEAIRRAEQKRIDDERKAKEEYEAAVEKAKAKIERRGKIYARLEQQLKKAMVRVVEAEKEYEELTGTVYIPENNTEEMKSNDILHQAMPGAC